MIEPQDLRKRIDGIKNLEAISQNEIILNTANYLSIDARKPILDAFVAFDQFLNRNINSRSSEQPYISFSISEYSNVIALIEYAITYLDEFGKDYLAQDLREVIINLNSVFNSES